MPMQDTFDAAGTHRFKFRIEGRPPSNIKQVTQLQMKYDVVQTKTIGASGMPQYNVWAGNKQYVGSMTVVRLMTDDVSWYEWFDTSGSNVKEARLDCWLEVHDPRTADLVPVRTYHFTQCMPSEFKISDMNATQAAAVDETLTFHYTNMTIDQAK